ncbi:MAG: DUF3306 domain-containing protein [Cocleimonas sp.]
MAVEKEGFASRWSRRKQEVEQEVDSVVDDIAVEEEIVTDEEALAEQRLEKLNALTDEDMPDIETLNEDSDFSGFMSTGVSEALRKMALQKLFHGKSYNVRDGLDEYDGDYTSFEKLDPSVITCDMKHLIEVEAEKLRIAKEEKEKEDLLLAEKENSETEAGEVELAEQEQSSEDSRENKREVVNGEDKQDEIKSMREQVAELDLDEMDDVEGGEREDI